MNSKVLFATAVLALNPFTGAFASNSVLYEDWSQCAGAQLPEGWSTIGTAKTPTGYAASCFEYGEGMKVMELPGATTSFAVSYSSTLEGGKVDTRLISPSFTIPEAGAILSFDAVNYNPESSAANKVEVFLTDIDGNNKQSLFMTRVPSNNIESPATYNISLREFAGRDAVLVIANEGTGAGLLGIGTISISEYVGSINDRTPLFTSSEDSRRLSFEVGLLAPCEGFSATLSTSTGLEEEFNITADLSNAYNIYPITSSHAFTLNFGQTMDYTLTVSPNMPGATPLTLTGSTGCAEGFPSICVEEEATGERCGYCPAGAAGIEKFSHEYGNRFIGIAIHCVDIFSTGVMEAPSYATPFVNNPAFPIESLPDAVLNRKLSQNPTLFDNMDQSVADILSGTSIAETKIQTVQYDKDSHNVKVKFTTKLALPLRHAYLRAAVVLLANDLKGSSLKWRQHNYYSGTTKEQFLEKANEAWWEYMQFYCEYPTDNISPTDMSFNHVAMGIFPDFYGEGYQLKEDWSDNTPDVSEIEFVMPMQTEPNGFGVQDSNNTTVVALVFDTRSGEIIAADSVDASSYNSTDSNNIIRTDATPLSIHYFTLDGMRHSAAPKGIAVKVTTYSDGSIKTEKIMVH